MSVLPLLPIDDAAQNPPARKKWFHLHVLLVAVMAFTGRAIPLSFLPIVLGKDFGQSSSTVGVVMAVYPLVALLATPWAAAIARRTQRIVALHSIAIIMVAFALALSVAAPSLQSTFGGSAGTVWLAVCRALQGLGASFYLSSNTSLLARKCPNDFTYLIGMMEVCSGAGGQIGRCLGGFLFDFGGLPCPVLVCALLQIVIGFVGLGFEDAASDVPEKQGSSMAEEESTAQMPWSELLTPRVCLGTLGAFMMYFNDGMINANIFQWMSVHLAPVTVGVMGMCSSFRSLCYLATSFALAQWMHRKVFSFECLLICGSILTLVGASLLAPQPFVTHAQAVITGAEPSYGCLFVTQLLSFAVCACGNACLFVPSLPLMQSEVHELGQTAVEQVAELFVMMMSLGEMVGPIFGGVLVEKGGFVFASLIMAFLQIPVFLLGVTTYDSLAIKSRQAAAMLIDEDFTRQVTDGEANVSLRMLPFVPHNLRSQQFSAPPTVFRRKYGAESRRKYGGKYGSSPPLLDIEARVPHAESNESASRKPYVPPFTSDGDELDTDSTFERQVATKCKKVVHISQLVDVYDELEIDKDIAIRQHTC